MDRLVKEIKTVKDRLSQMEPMLLMLHRSVKDMDRNEEHIEHRLSVSEECSEDLGKRVAVLEEYVGLIHVHVNGAIERINTLHQCLKELTNEDLECDETIKDSSDDEFELEDMDEKFETEAKRLKKQ